MKIFVCKNHINLYLHEACMYDETWNATWHGMSRDMSMTWWRLVVYVQRNPQNHCTMYFLLYIAINDSKHRAKYILSMCSARLPEMICCLSQVFVTTVKIVATQHFFSCSPHAHVQNIMVVFVTGHIEHMYLINTY